MKMRDRKVFMLYADTGKPVKTRTGKPAAFRDVDIIRMLDKKGWKVRGRSVYLSPGMRFHGRIVSPNGDTLRYCSPDE